MNLLCKLGIHIGCQEGYFIPLIIEFGFNGQNGDEARKQLEEILPGIKTRLQEYEKQYPIRVLIGHPKRS